MKKHIFFSLCMICLLSAFSAKAQHSIAISGQVISQEDGLPIAGVRLSLDDRKSVMTDQQGRFSLEMDKELLSASSLLTVYAPGYETKKIFLAKGKSQMQIVLHKEGVRGMEKILTLPLLGQVSSLETPFSVSTVSPQERHQTASSPDVVLQGTVAGLNTLFHSGQPGSGSNMYLHGLGSLNAGSQPLIIVDGMPYENDAYASSISGYYANPLSAIEVKDVESITVLKDAASIYGTKAANGVILINTIKAQEASTQITAYAHAGVNLKQRSLPMLNARDYKTYLTDLLMSSGDYTIEEIQNLPYIDQEKPVADQYNRYRGNQDYYRYNQETDWQRMIYDSNLNQDYYIRIKGGDEMALYALSIGYLKQKGALSGTEYGRFSTRFNSDIKITNRFKARTNMSFSYGQRWLQNEGEVSNTNILYSSLAKAPFTAPYIYSADGSVSPNLESADVFGGTNIRSMIDNMVLRNLNYRFMGILGLNYAIAKNWAMDGMFGMHFNKDRERIFYPAEGFAYESLPTADVNNRMQHRVERWFDLYGDLHLAYNKKLNDASELKWRLGTRYQYSKSENDAGTAYNSTSDDFQSLNYGSSALRNINGNLGDYNWWAVYTQLNYSLKNRYILSALVSADHSSRFGVDRSNPFVLYPEIAGAWIVNAEDFMAGADAVDLLKVRISTGMSGNDDIGNYNGRKHYVSHSFLGAYGLVKGILADTNLKPETTTKWNIGLDLSLWNEAFNMSVDAYRNNISDMLVYKTPERWTGSPYYISNGGTMYNQGIDVDMGIRLLSTTQWKWNLNIIASTYLNQVTNLDCESIDTEINGATIRTQEGSPLGIFYGYKTDGVYASQAEAEADGYYLMNGSVPAYFAGGDVRFVNQTGGDQLIDEKDRVQIGDPNPDLFGAIVTSVQWRNFGLTLQFNYSLGNDVYNYRLRQIESMSGYDNQTQATLHRWRYDGQQTDMPKAVWGDPMANSRFSDRWIEDGSYLRMKFLTLNYQLPPIAPFIRNCTAFVTAENLMTITKCKDLDPEYGGQHSSLGYGVGSFSTPLPRIVSVGLKIGL